MKDGDTGGGRIKIYSKHANVVLLVSGESTAQALALPRGEHQPRAAKGEDLVEEYHPKRRPLVSCSGSIPGKGGNLLKG